MSAHTPGPWEVSAPYVRTRFDINEGGGTCIAEIDTITAEHVANARLIAASPDLLAALDALVTACEVPGENCEVEQALPAAIAAIAKATGE